MKTKNKYDVVIVTDGNPQIGLGHIMRCVAIADALTEMKISVLFIASDTMSVSEIKILGYDVLCLNTDYKALRDQSDKIAEIVIEYHIRFVFFDSYFASNELFGNVSKHCPVGCFGYGKNYYCGIKLIVPYGISSVKKWYETMFDPRKTDILFGSKYVPLKKTYWNLPIKDGCHVPKKLLLTNGGTDSMGITVELIKSIRGSGIDIDIDVIVGKFYDTNNIITGCKKLTGITLHENLTDLSGIMKSADVAISAGGMTLYELMASSVPTIAYAIADNQLGNRLLDGGILWCGDIRKESHIDIKKLDLIISKLKELLDSAEKRKELIMKGYSICDGQGAKRIAERIAVIAK